MHDEETSLEEYTGWVSEVSKRLTTCKVVGGKLGRNDRTRLLNDIAMMHAGITEHGHVLRAMLVAHPSVSYVDVRALRRDVMRDVEAINKGLEPKVVATVEYGLSLCLFLAGCEAELWSSLTAVRTEDRLLYEALAKR